MRRASRPLCHSFIKYYTFSFVKDCQNLMLGQNLPPKTCSEKVDNCKTNARDCTSVPTGGAPSLNLVSFKDQNVVDEKCTGIF